MDQMVAFAHIAAVALRREEARTMRADAKLEWACDRCGVKHQNYNSHIEHGLCRKCRDVDFNLMRAHRVCCRCGAQVAPFTPLRSRPEDNGRFLFCATCGLVISTAADDKVAGVAQERRFSND